MLSNVIALVVVLVGLVALIQLPSSQYPNVVPPTVQVTTRYPGASARTLVDSVALPIEQNVNGVENMIYMQSTSADDGTYTLAVTFAIGTNPDMAQVLVQNRVADRLVLAAGRGAGPGRDDQEAVDLDPRIRRSGLARQPLRQPVPVELRRHQRAGRASPPRRRRRRDRARRRAIRDARLARTRTCFRRAGLVPQDVINIIQQQSQEVTAGQVGAPPAPKGQDFQYTLNLKGRLDDPTEFENIIVKVDPAQRRSDHPGPRRRPRRARRPDLQRVVQPRRPSGRGNRRFACCRKPTPSRSPTR